MLLLKNKNYTHIIICCVSVTSKHLHYSCTTYSCLQNYLRSVKYYEPPSHKSERINLSNAVIARNGIYIHGRSDRCYVHRWGVIVFRWKTIYLDCNNTSIEECNPRWHFFFFFFLYTSSVHTAIKSEHKGNSQLAERLILRLPNKQKPEKKKNKSDNH